MKNIVMAMAISLLSVSAFASEYTSADQLPVGSAVEAMFDTTSGKPVCPPKHVVAKKYCWNKKAFRFKHCGYFCNSTAVPPYRH